jgi:hypothetical protein
VHSSIVIPAQAGIHLSAFEAMEEWVPACAGTTIFVVLARGRETAKQQAVLSRYRPW